MYVRDRQKQTESCVQKGRELQLRFEYNLQTFMCTNLFPHETIWEEKECLRGRTMGDLGL
jgi:hypothetical protein